MMKVMVIAIAIVLFSQPAQGAPAIQVWDENSQSWVAIDVRAEDIARNQAFKFESKAAGSGAWVADLISQGEQVISSKRGTGPIEGIFSQIPPGKYLLKITCQSARHCEAPITVTVGMRFLLPKKQLK